jgi:hypothetical protein
VGAQLPQQLYCTVGGDNVAGGALAGAHLLAQGRQRAFFGDINLPEIGQRYEGLCQALAQAGMAVDPALQVQASFVPDGGRLAVEELLRRGVAFDAVFAGSDLMAMTAINSLRQLGIEVPRQWRWSATTISSCRAISTSADHGISNRSAAGRALVASLLELTEGRPGALAVQLPTQLIVRASSVLIYATDCIELARLDEKVFAIQCNRLHKAHLLNKAATTTITGDDHAPQHPQTGRHRCRRNRSPAHGRRRRAETPATDGLNMERVVVTGTSGASSKMKTSVSISTLEGDAIKNAAPLSAPKCCARCRACVRNRRAARATPTSRCAACRFHGGARYVQIQEDGLPV